MARQLKTPADWEKFDRTRLELAIAEVRESENLRFLLRYMMADLNPLGFINGENTTLMAQDSGRHNAAAHFVGTLDQFDSRLWLELQLESLAEGEARNNGDSYAPDPA